MTDKKMKPADRWRGKRYIALVRQSDDRDGTTSTEAQAQWLHEYGQSLGMTCVGDIILNGVTGSLPGLRLDLDGLLTRKREKDDFEVLLVQRCDRLTRGGSSHAFWFEYECSRLSISVLYAGDDLPEDARYGSLIKVAKFEAANEQARSISQRSVQGSMYALQQGRKCVTSRTPHGCDRVYLNNEGQPQFVIRNLTDGRQLKLDPETGTVIDTLGQSGGGAKGHYRKQQDEYPQLIPGDKDKADTVRLIFDLHYNQGLGGKRISDVLNRRGILSPTGKGWSQRQVESIYENPVYAGVALGTRISQGIYYRRGQNHPEQVVLDAAILANCTAAPRLKRPPDEWQWQEQPRMKDFLPADLAGKALAEIRKLHVQRYERSIDPSQPKRSPSKHKTSEYILTNILKARQDGAPLTGVLCGRVGKKVRYYRHRRGRLGYRKGSVFNRMIKAEPLERAVLELIHEIVSNPPPPEVRQRILDAIHAQLPLADAEEALAQLRRDRDGVRNRVQLIARTLDPESLADAQAELDRLSAQRRELESQIATMERRTQYGSEDPDELADRVLARLAKVDASMQGLSAIAKRQLIEAFVERVEVDLASKDAQVILRIPPWALEKADSAMRPAHNSALSTSYETHPLAGLRLTYADCRYVHDRSQRSICYRCQRRPRAA